MQTSDDIWQSTFPAIFCINLKERDDRFLNMMQTFTEMGIPKDFVQLFRRDRDPRGGRFGCADSHIFMMRKAIQMNVPYALFLEDDIIPEKNWRPQLKQVQEFLKSGEPFDILRLYSMIRLPVEQVKGDIWEVGSLSGAAYVLSRPFMLRMATLKYDGVHIDCLHSLVAKRSLDIYPPVFNVNDSKSDNQWGNSANTSALSKFLSVYQSTFSSRASIDFQNRGIALIFPKFLCQYGNSLLRKGIINGNVFPKELIEALDIKELKASDDKKKQKS